MDKVLLMIPAFNEEKNLTKLLKSIKKYNRGYDILIINDSSTDNTQELMQRMHMNIVNLPCNLGIGGAMQTGYKYAEENNYDFAIQVDGDGQHDPMYIDSLIKKCKEGYNMVIGSRFIEKKGFQSTIFRRLGIRFFYYLIKLLTYEKITDATSGFRIVDKKIIKIFSKSYPTDYPEPETIVILIKRKFKVTEIPVVMKSRERGVSSINFFKSIYYMLKVTISIIIAYFTK